MLPSSYNIEILMLISIESDIDSHRIYPVYSLLFTSRKFGEGSLCVTVDNRVSRINYPCIKTISVFHRLT